MKHGYSAGEAARYSICWADRGYVWPPAERGLGVLMMRSTVPSAIVDRGRPNARSEECEEDKGFCSQ